MSIYFDIEADTRDYEVESDEPYLTKDLGGRYVILQDELLKAKNPTENTMPLLYSSQILIDDNPSKAVIFKMKLKGQFRPSTFVAHHHSKGS